MTAMNAINPINAIAQSRKYLWIARASARSSIAYFGETAGRFIFLGLIIYIFLCLWRETYSQTGAHLLGGLTLAQMLWYLTITEAITLSAPRVSQLVDEDVRTGNFATQLVRPMSYPLYRMSHSFGDRLVRFLTNLAIGGLLTSLLVGTAPLNLPGIALLLVTIPLAFTIDFLGNFLVGLAAFWLEDTNGLLLLYSRANMILGGMLLPIELFPPQAQPIVKMLPFSSIVYGPAKMFVDPSAGALCDLIIKQALAIVVFGSLVFFIYNFARRRVFLNGG